MHTNLAVALALIFALLGAWHFYMAFSPPKGANGAVPSIGGKPLFVPSARATFCVGVVLLFFGALVSATSGLISLGLPQYILRGLCFVLALGLLARAIGEFKHVGLFKRNRGSRFATLDTYVYSPLCLLLSVGVALVAAHNGA